MGPDTICEHIANQNAPSTKLEQRCWGVGGVGVIDVQCVYRALLTAILVSICGAASSTSTGFVLAAARQSVSWDNQHQRQQEAIPLSAAAEAELANGVSNGCQQRPPITWAVTANCWPK